MTSRAQADRPARLLLATLGSRGDVEPFVHLARAAQNAGFTVRIAIPDQQDINTDGLDTVSLGIRFADLTQKPGTSVSRSFREQIRPAMSRALAAFMDTGMDWTPDIIVSHPKLLTAPVLAARYGIPHLTVELTPTVTPTAQFPAAGITSRSLGSVLNRASYRIVDIARRMFAADIRTARSRLGIRRGRLPAPAASLVAISPNLLPRPSDWPATAHITGEWHRSSRDPLCDAELREFIEADAPFVYAGFGSMTGGDASARAEAVIEGARRAGLRVAMMTGWGGLQPPTRCLGPDVLVTESAPHAAVLRHAVAAIHHGGAGTTHAVARAGIPSVVVPFLADQPFWAAQLRRIGLAPAPLHRDRLTPERIRIALATSMDCASHARTVAQQMGTEDGTTRALSLIATYTRSHPSDTAQHSNRLNTSAPRL